MIYPSLVRITTTFDGYQLLIRTMLGSCDERDWDQPTRDVVAVPNISGLAECQRLCQLEPRCTKAAYGWTGSKAKHCWLKDEPLPGGPKVGVSMIPKVCDCLERDVKYDGPGIIFDNVADVFKCQGLCQGTVGCNFFSYDVAAMICSTMSQVLTERPGVGTVSGLRNACN